MAPALMFCCESIRKLNTPQQSPLPARLHDLLNNQKGTPPYTDNAGFPLTGDFYDHAVLCIVESGVYPEGITYSSKSWFAPIIPTGDGTSWFVEIANEKVSTAQQEGYIEKEWEKGSTCRFGGCRNDTSLKYEARWHPFIKRESDSESEAEGMYEIQAEQSEVEEEEGGSELSEDEMEQSEVEEEEDGSEMSQVQSEQSSSEEEGASGLSQPQSVQQSIAPPPQPSMSSLPPVQPSANAYQHLRDRVRNGRGLPCDECARVRKPCSRKLTPGGPPRCDRCRQRNIPCVWNTVGSGRRDNRSGN
jgi:hypothetical protein